jgi:hypothetical protein
LNLDLVMTQEGKMPETARFYDRETVTIMKLAFDEACAGLPPGRATQSARALVAECILKAAAAGERDPESAPMHCRASIERRDGCLAPPANSGPRRACQVRRDDVRLDADTGHASRDRAPDVVQHPWRRRFIRASMRFLTFENPSPTGASPIGAKNFG